MRYLRLQLDTQLLQLLLMFLLQLLQSHFGLDADSWSRSVIQGADGCSAKKVLSVLTAFEFENPACSFQARCCRVRISVTTNRFEQISITHDHSSS